MRGCPVRVPVRFAVGCERAQGRRAVNGDGKPAEGERMFAIRTPDDCKPLHVGVRRGSRGPSGLISLCRLGAGGAHVPAPSCCARPLTLGGSVERVPLPARRAHQVVRVLEEDPRFPEPLGDPPDLHRGRVREPRDPDPDRVDRLGVALELVAGGLAGPRAGMRRLRPSRR